MTVSLMSGVMQGGTGAGNHMWNLVAMGNGKEELKKEADYVTADIDDDGIEKALIHFGVIDA